MIVSYASSPTFYPLLKASITSLLEHNDVTKLYILAQEDELPFEIPCNHQVINVSYQTYFPPYGANMRNNIFTYLAMIRSCLPDLIEEDKVISLDSDLIVCDSLEPIWQIDLTGKWLAWCPEYLGNWNPWQHEHYYNFGVVVMNLAQMRKDNAVETVVNDLNTNWYGFPEQDMFNKIAVPDLSVEIPERFNECFATGQSDHPAIVHYAGYGDLRKKTKMLPRREYLEKYL